MGSNADAKDFELRHGPEATAALVAQQVSEALAEQSTTDIPRVRLIRASSMTLRAPHWLVKGWFERPSLALVFGAPGCGKSFLGVDMACCVATGVEFHGHAVEAGPVVYVAGEGHNGIRRRTSAWERARGRSLDDADLYVTEAPVGLTDPGDCDALLEAVERVTGDGAAPRLVVVDTLARNFGPGDENSTQDMTQFIQACDRIRVQHDCTVLLVHHTGHASSERARGNSSLLAATDTAFRLDKDAAGVIRVENTRQKDAELLDPLAFKLRSVDLGLLDEDGRPVTSAALEPTAYEPTAQGGGAKLGKNQAKALAALIEVTEQHQANLAASGRSIEEARVSVEDWRNRCTEQGLDRKRFREARSSLIGKDKVVEQGGFVWLP